MVDAKGRWAFITGASRGIVVGAFVDDKKSGRCFGAGDFYGMSLEEAVAHAEKDIPKYLGSLD